MSLKSLLTPELQLIFYEEYHNFLAKAKRNPHKYHLHNFFKTLRIRNKEFNNFSNDKLNNKLIASRRKEGIEEWPNLTNIESYISPYLKNFIIKAHQSALLSVEIYNKPLISYRSEGFIVMMMVAWTSLFHAIFLKQGEKIRYKENGKDNYLDLRRCIKKYEGKLKKEIEANLGLLIEIRDQIIHRESPLIEDRLFGYCQACLFNFEELLIEYFGTNYQLPNTLAYSLQFSKNYQPQQFEAIKKYKNKGSYKLLDFINEYESDLFKTNPEIYTSQSYCIRIYIIPKIVKGNKAEASVEYIKYDSLDAEATEKINKAILIIKENRVGGDYYKASDVCKIVYERLENRKGPEWKFNASFHHSKAAKYFKIREGYKTNSPDKTMKEYCYYDPLFKQYIYTKQWIDFLVKKLKDEKTYKDIYITK